MSLKYSDLCNGSDRFISIVIQFDSKNLDVYLNNLGMQSSCLNLNLITLCYVFDFTVMCV